MIRKVAVGDVMTRNFSATSPEKNLFDCARQMVKERVGSLLVTEKNRLLGILTQKDVLWAITKKPDINLRNVKAIDVATRKVAVIKPSLDIIQAFHKMKRYGFRRLPVLSRGQVVGLLTLKDLLAIEPTLLSRAGELIDIREEAQKRLRVDSPIENEDGLCDNCGALADLLKVGDSMLCPDCREEMY